MMLGEAFSNIADSYRFQTRLRGSLAVRLSALTLYWAVYLASTRLLGRRSPGAAHLAGLQALRRLGLTRRPVRIGLESGLRLELDVFTCLHLLKEILQDGIYEGPEIESFLPGPGECVIDAGAQQGIFTTLAASRVGPEGRVIAFEPAPDNLSFLRRNVEENGFSNTTIVSAALSDAEGTAALRLHPFNTGGHSLVGDAGGPAVSVECTTLDAYLSRFPCPPACLKIDVEGSAPAVLRGARSTLERFKPRIAVETDGPQDAERTRAILSSMGCYKIQSLGNNIFAWPAAPRG